MNRRCLVIRCGDPDPDVVHVYGRFTDWFRRMIDARVEVDVLDARMEEIHARRLEGVGAVLVTGSAHAVYEPHPWLPPLEALVREAVDARGLPFLGVCFGHQLLAKSLGGAVARNPRGREMGTVEVTLNDHGADAALFRALPRRFRAQATHQDTVVAPPPRARVLARSALDDCQAFSVGPRAWGVQFHPEFSGEVLRAYVRSRRAALQREGLDPDALHDAITEEPAGRVVMTNFVALAFDLTRDMSED